MRGLTTATAAVASTAGATPECKDRWCLDSGASVHVDHSRDGMTGYTKTIAPQYLNTAGTQTIPVDGIGDRREFGVDLSDVRHVSLASKRLVSVVVGRSDFEKKTSTET